MNDERYRELIDIAKEHYGDSIAHNRGHTKNVLNNAIKISGVEGGDLEVLKIAAILHDIAKQKEENGEVECHAREGAEMAREILNKINYPEQKTEEVCYAIRIHRKSSKQKPETIEAAILQDADRLDCIGINLIIRFLICAGKYDIPLYDIKSKSEDHWSKKGIINQIKEKTEMLKPEKFNTEYARKLAKGEYEYSLDFVNKFMSEWNEVSSLEI